ncbi:MAG: integrase core domain-containing protein [Thermoleophilia bacterium]
MRDDLPKGELFYALKEAQILIANWGRLYNSLRQHSTLRQRPPTAETIVCSGYALANYDPQSATPKMTGDYHKMWTDGWDPVSRARESPRVRRLTVRRLLLGAAERSVVDGDDSHTLQAGARPMRTTVLVPGIQHQRLPVDTIDRMKNSTLPSGDWA